MPVSKKEPKKLTEKQKSKADALIAKLGIKVVSYDPALVKLDAKAADERAKDFAKLLAIITPKRKKPAAKA